MLSTCALINVVFVLKARAAQPASNRSSAPTAAVPYAVNAHTVAWAWFRGVHSDRPRPLPPLLGPAAAGMAVTDRSR
jgi:hypothetical protein